MSNNIGREHFQVLNTFWLSQYSNFWQVANSNVRLNALHLLLDVFPLEDPDVTKDVNDPLLEKQFFLLDKLLMDDCPEIRAVTVEGLCRILNQFWEVIPSPTISKNLSKIVDDMSKDSCNDVRLSTLNGLIYLLDNPQSHDILKILLPRLSDMVSDPALSVRVAAVDLLLAIRDLRSFQYNKVWYMGVIYIS
jgi:condensin-2 complex subunit G2